MTSIDGPALVFTDDGDALEAPTARDLTTGAALLGTGSPGGCNLQPRLSPDGATYLFLQFSNFGSCDGTSSLQLRGLDGSTQTLAVAPPNAWFDLPNFSPDGSTVLYSMEQDDAAGNFVSANLYTVPTAGGSPTIVAGGGTNAWDGVYSPDGNMIAASTAFSTTTQFAVMKADGSNVTVLPTSGISPYSPSFPAWSPDGSQISFQYNKKGGTWYNYGIAVVPADGSAAAHVLPVTAAASATSFVSSWSADGTEIYYDGATRSTATGDFITGGSIYATDASGTYRTTIVAATATDWYWDPFFVAPGPSTGSASTYTAVDPERLQTQVAVGAGGFVDVTVTGGTTGVPTNATAVTLNVTGVKATKATYLQAYPKPASGNGFPTVSNLNLVPGETAAAAVQVTVPASGVVRIRNNAGTTGVIVDLSGYFTPGTSAAGFVPLPAPVRALDQGLLATGHADVDVASITGAPANAVAVVLNLTGDRGTKANFESVVPTPLTVTPGVSNLNLVPGETRANLVTAKIGTGGKVTVYNSAGSIRTIVDVIGYYTSDPGHLAYYPLSPTRTLDTRLGLNTGGGSTGPLGNGGVFDWLVQGTVTTSNAIVTVPATAQAVAFTLTAAGPTGNTYLTAYSPNAARPTASNVNANHGTTVPNLVISAVGSTGSATGKVRLYNHVGTTPTIADLAGYYA